MLASALVVVVIAQAPGGPLLDAFERTTRKVLGSGARVEMHLVAQDPPDGDSAARAAEVDGLVELSLSNDGARAHLHCYFSGEKRWVDRVIDFGGGAPGSAREQLERGRLLGLAVATMFGPSDADEAAGTPPGTQPPEQPVATRATALDAPHVPSDEEAQSAAAGSRSPHRYGLDFLAIASTGIRGTAAGLGASGVLRLHGSGPLWSRAFVSGRFASIPAAECTTRTVFAGGGVELAILPAQSRFELGLRGDAFAVYFDAEHFSEDDVTPFRRSRWLAGFAWGADLGVRLTETVGFVGGAGLEVLTGKTDIFTHGNLVATVPALRAVAEIGIRSRF